MSCSSRRLVLGSLKHVQARAPHNAAVQRVKQRLLANHLAVRRVNNGHTALQLGERGRIQEMMRLGRVREAEANDVRRGQQRVEVNLSSLFLHLRLLR